MNAPFQMTSLIVLCMILASLGIFVTLMLPSMLILLRLRHDPERLEEPLRRLKGLLKFGLGQKKMVDPEEFKPGLAHVFIFGAFMILAMRTVTLFGMAFAGWDFH